MDIKAAQGYRYSNSFSDDIHGNKSAIMMGNNPTFFGRSKHIQIKYHVVRKYMKWKMIKLRYNPIERQLSDILTKLLCSKQFTQLREKLGFLDTDPPLYPLFEKNAQKNLMLEDQSKKGAKEIPDLPKNLNRSQN